MRPYFNGSGLGVLKSLRGIERVTRGSLGALIYRDPEKENVAERLLWSRPTLDGKEDK